jgi:hypothetical protein
MCVNLKPSYNTLFKNSVRRADADDGCGVFLNLGMCLQRIAQQRLIYEMIESLKMWRYLLCCD